MPSGGTMQIQINTDRNIEGHEALETLVRGEVERALNRFRAQVTRVEVHLSDENSHKSGESDKRCVIEARLEDQRPIAATHQAATLDQAIDGAASKLSRLIESTLGRLYDQKARRPERPPG
jgi:ribosomal subunit interface protein